MATMEELSQSTVQQVQQAIEASTGAIFMSKSSPLWEKVAELALGIPSKFGVVPKPEEFLDNYGTTIGKIVGMPRKPMSTLQTLYMLVHEGGHVLQFCEGGLTFVKDYLFFAEKRAAFEAACFVQEAAISMALEGHVSVKEIDRVQSLVYGYMLKDGDIRLAAELIDQQSAMISAGYVQPAGNGVSTAIIAIQTIKRLQPNALNADALAAFVSSGLII